MIIKPGKLLRKIETPKDLKQLNLKQLLQLCNELRQFIVDNVSIYGGHLGASLGTVELTIAVHRVFNTPDDRLVWDVGHQAYGHKILTRRRDIFHTNRTYKGISGFPKISESEYDTFGVGHSSTSISAALGMAIASKYKGDIDKQHIAIIGDGALTGGMAFEALNHTGISESNILIILNDNCMSIDPNVGALKNYLTRITASEMYNKFKDDVWELLNKLSHFGKSVQEITSKIETGIKSTLLNESNFFESLNLRYFGPIDGHDVERLISVLSDLKKIKGPKILHCITVKGKGYEPAEKGNKTAWHAPGRFDKTTGKIHKKNYDEPQPPKYQDVFGHTLVELAKENPKIMGITPAMPSGSSMNKMMEEMPDRAFDVGIAEQHAVTLSAGMASQGMVPFCNIYSSFMQRAYDQVIHDVCLQNLPVNFCLDRAGIVGADGATHHGAYDLAYLRCIPNMIVTAPMNERELRNLMYTASLDRKSNPFSIRYPRGRGVMTQWKTSLEQIAIGSSEVVQEGEDLAILTIGHVGNHAITACKKVALRGLYPAHINMRFLKPIDENQLHIIFKRFKKILTVEDGCIQGGCGSAILEFMANYGYNWVKIRRLGIPDKIVEHGTQSELHSECGFDYKSIERAILEILEPSLLKK